MKIPALPIVAFALVACSGDKLTGVAAQDAVREHQTAQVATGKEPLVILDGKEISIAQARAIDALTIESVQVLKGNAAQQKFGNRGSNGVILIARKSDNR